MGNFQSLVGIKNSSRNMQCPSLTCVSAFMNPQLCRSYMLLPWQNLDSNVGGKSLYLTRFFPYPQNWPKLNLTFIVLKIVFIPLCKQFWEDIWKHFPRKQCLVRHSNFGRYGWTFRIYKGGRGRWVPPSRQISHIITFFVSYCSYGLWVKCFWRIHL